MEVDWLILADYAEVTNNKLYVMGGGWDVLTINTSFPAKHRCAVAAAFRVPWNETNQRHNAEIEVSTEDGKILANAGGQFEVGRPAGMPAGQDQRWQLAIGLEIGLEKPGVYTIVAKVEGQEEKRTNFRVIGGPLLALQQQSAEIG